MTPEVKGSTKYFEPHPERIGKDEGELFVRIFLPYSSLHWANPEKFRNDRDAIYKREIPPGLLQFDEDYYAKKEDGSPMPGNITEDIYWAVHHMLPVWRLSRIKQLALLTHSAEDEVNYYAKGIGFSQTRLNHSFLVARPLEFMMENNGFPKEDVNNGIIAGMSHDIATPPWGDPTKEIDPEVLDEEVSIRKLFFSLDLSPLKQFGFDENKVLDAVQNKGPIGKLLDIADKLSYTAIDVYEFIGTSYIPDTFSPYEGVSQMTKTLKPMRDLIANDPKWADIYEEVRMDNNDDPYFENIDRLSTFLELRARMHKGLYLNPHCRAQDMLYKMLMKPLYSRDSDPDFPFNPDNLLTLSDEEADRIIVKSWPFLDKSDALNFTLGVLPNYVKVKEPAHIEGKIKKLQKRGALVIGSETIRRFNPATGFRAIDPKDGKIKPFSEILPEKAKELADMVDHCNQTVVYYWPEETDPQSQEVKLKPTIEQIIEDAKRRNGGRLPSYSLYN